MAIVEESSGLLVGGQLGTWETGSVSGYDEMAMHEEGGFGEEINVDLKFSVVIPKIYPRCSVAGECVSAVQFNGFGAEQADFGLGAAVDLVRTRGEANV